jgi:hypothetical protein
MPSNNFVKELFEAHPVLSALYELLIAQADAQGLDTDDGLATAIIAASNGLFVMADHDGLVVTHKTHEDLAFPIQIVVFDDGGTRMSMTVDPPETDDPNRSVQ